MPEIGLRPELARITMLCGNTHAYECIWAEHHCDSGDWPHCDTVPSNIDSDLSQLLANPNISTLVPSVVSYNLLS